MCKKETEMDRARGNDICSFVRLSIWEREEEDEREKEQPG